MSAPSEEDLIDAIETAAERAISALFDEHPEHFYYCSLMTTGEASAPVLTAWSEEALDRAVAEQGLEEREVLRWSFADSPYFCYGEEHFNEVQRLFGERPPMIADLSTNQWMQEYDFRVRCMEEAMRMLDGKGLFGEGEKRRNIVINVEVMDADHTNTERALRLNPRESLTEWLATVAPPSPEWYAVDEAGQVGYFTTDPGRVPGSICSSFEDAQLVRNYFHDMADNISESEMLWDNILKDLNDHQKERYAESPSGMAKKGLFCFDDTFGYGTFCILIAMPTKSISLNDIPEDIKAILSRTKFKINFDNIKRISNEDVKST